MPTVELAPCNECGRRTRHHEKANYSTSGEDGIVTWRITYSVLECGGCGTVSFRERVWFSEHQESDPDADPVYGDKYYPPRLDRAEPTWFVDLPDELQDVLAETYDAIYHDSRYLAAVGVRTALDMAIVAKIGDAGTFQDKLELLELSGVTKPQDSALLKVAIEAGNAAAHRGFRPPSKHLVVMREILESVLEALFIRSDRIDNLKRLAEELKQSVPPRRGRQSPRDSAGPNEE